MRMYLTRFRYTHKTWARLVKNPEDRRAAAKQYIDRLAGSCTASGTPSAITMAITSWDAPDNVSMAATAIAIGAGGALKFHSHNRSANRQRRDPEPPRLKPSAGPR